MLFLLLGIVKKLFLDICSRFSRFFWKQYDPFWHFIIFHPTYCFPEFLSLIKGPYFTAPPHTPKKHNLFHNLLSELNKNWSVTAAVMVMPISQCDLCAHFTLKMTLPSICQAECPAFFKPGLGSSSTWNSRKTQSGFPPAPLSCHVHSYVPAQRGELQPWLKESEKFGGEHVHSSIFHTFPRSQLKVNTFMMQVQLWERDWQTEDTKGNFPFPCSVMLSWFNSNSPKLTVHTLGLLHMSLSFQRTSIDGQT